MLDGNGVSRMMNFLNLPRGRYLHKLIVYRFKQYAVNQKISHKNYRESLGIIGIESLSFMCDRMFNIMDKDKDGFVSHTYFYTT